MCCITHSKWDGAGAREMVLDTGRRTWNGACLWYTDLGAKVMAEFEELFYKLTNFYTGVLSTSHPLIVRSQKGALENSGSVHNSSIFAVVARFQVLSFAARFLKRQFFGEKNKRWKLLEFSLFFIFLRNFLLGWYEHKRCTFWPEFV